MSVGIKRIGGSLSIIKELDCANTHGEEKNDIQKTINNVFFASIILLNLKNIWKFL